MDEFMGRAWIGGGRAKRRADPKRVAPLEGGTIGRWGLVPIQGRDGPSATGAELDPSSRETPGNSCIHRSPQRHGSKTESGFGFPGRARFPEPPHPFPGRGIAGCSDAGCSDPGCSDRFCRPALKALPATPSRLFVDGVGRVGTA